MTITLINERPESWNKIYSGQHWSKRAAEAQRVHFIVSHFGVHLEGIRTAPKTPVDITITAYFDKRPLDADNIASKFYIDGLKGWLIKDDSPQYVRSVTTRSMTDREHPRVEICIEEVIDK